MRDTGTAGLAPGTIAAAGKRRATADLRGPDKLLLALGVFALVFGSWVVARNIAVRRAAETVLPDDRGKEGACAVWFVGSSTIYKWSTLHRDMRPWVAHNRGVNGASIAQIVQQFGNDPDRTPPQAIVFYGGDNDIAHGETPRDAVTDLARFLNLKARRLGRVPVFIVSVKPSPTRWMDRAKQDFFNAAARRFTERRPDLHYVDLVPSMTVGGGFGDYYVEDGIHLNAAGYRVWSRAIAGALRAAMPAKVVRRCTRNGGAR